MTRWALRLHCRFDSFSPCPSGPLPHTSREAANTSKGVAQPTLVAARSAVLRAVSKQPWNLQGLGLGVRLRPAARLSPQVPAFIGRHRAC